MKPHWPTLRTLVIASLAAALACTDQRPTVAEGVLREAVEGQSGGALSLESFRKANGYERDVAGMMIYTLEWEATLSVKKEFWKPGNALVGYWQDFRVLPGQPDTWGNLMSGGSKRFVEGAKVLLAGESQLQDTDNGWRVMDMTVTRSGVEGNEGAAPQARVSDQLETVPTAPPLAPPLHPEEASYFVGKWQLVAGEKHPVTGQLVKSTLEFRDSPTRPQVIWVSELDGSMEHAIDLVFSEGRMVGNYYGGTGNVVIDASGTGDILFSIDPFAHFEPIRNSRFSRIGGG